METVRSPTRELERLDIAPHAYRPIEVDILGSADGDVQEGIGHRRDPVERAERLLHAPHVRCDFGRREDQPDVLDGVAYPWQGAPERLERRLAALEASPSRVEALEELAYCSSAREMFPTCMRLIVTNALKPRGRDSARESVMPQHAQASFEENDGQMRWTEWLLCWFKPSHWRDDQPLTPGERAGANPVDGPDGYIDPQRGVGAEGYDRVDVERDVRKP